MHLSRLFVQATYYHPFTIKHGWYASVHVEKNTCVSLDDPKSTCKVTKGSAKNCKRSYEDKVHTPFESSKKSKLKCKKK